MVDLYRRQDGPNEGLVEIHVVPDLITMGSGKLSSIRGHASQAKVTEHLAAKAKINIAVPVVLIVHESHIAQAVFRREGKREAVESLQGPYTSPFVGDLSPVKVLQHAQVIPASSTGTVLHHQVWKAFAKLPVHRINRVIVPPVTVFDKAFPPVLRPAEPDIRVIVQAKHIQFVAFNQTGECFFRKLDNFGIGEVQGSLTFAGSVDSYDPVRVFFPQLAGRPDPLDVYP